MDGPEKDFWLEGDDGLKPYLRLKDKGMPRGKVEQIAWLLLSGSACGFCLVCRGGYCDKGDRKSCTEDIADYIRECVRGEMCQKSEKEQE